MPDPGFCPATLIRAQFLEPMENSNADKYDVAKKSHEDIFAGVSGVQNIFGETISRAAADHPGPIDSGNADAPADRPSPSDSSNAVAPADPPGPSAYSSSYNSTPWKDSEWWTSSSRWWSHRVWHLRR